ncbi:MAG: hypothetical protein MJZ68_00920 [archaeon]|nr:hypothetical protein [archaeon]
MQLLKSDKTDLDVLLGEPRRAIRLMFLPFLIAMAVVQINQFVDTFWVAGLGNTSAEAVSTVVPIYALMVCAGLGISVGATTTIAFRLGRKEHEAANSLAANSLILGIIFGILAAVIVAIVINPAIDFLGAQSVRDESIAYLIPYMVMCPVMLVDSIIGGTLRGEGAARKSTIVQMSAAIFNMVIDPILIYGLNMGVMGAGLSTTVSALLSVMIALYWYRTGKTVIRLDRKSFKVDKAMMREVFAVGGPSAGRTAISDLTDFFQRFFLIIAGGTTSVMLYNYTWKYIGIVNLPGRAFDSAMVPVCSAALGQSDVDKMKTGFLYTMKLAITCSVIFTIVLFVFAEPLMSILTYEESMHKLLSQFVWTLQVSTLLIPFSALMGVCSSLLQAMKKAKIPMYFYMLWGFGKLGLYALAAYGYMGIDPFEGIIYSMVLIHIIGGICLLSLALWQFKKVKASVEASKAVA